MKSRRKVLFWFLGIVLALSGGWLYAMLRDDTALPADDLEPPEPAAGDSNPPWTPVLAQPRTLRSAYFERGDAITAMLTGDRTWDPSLMPNILESAPLAEQLLDEALASPRWSINTQSWSALDGIYTSLHAQTMAEINAGGGKAVALVEKLLGVSSRLAAKEGAGTVRLGRSYLFRAAPLVMRCVNLPGLSDPDLERLRLAVQGVQAPGDRLVPAIRRNHKLVRSMMLDSSRDRKDIFYEVLINPAGNPAFQFQPVASANLLAGRARRLLPTFESVAVGNPAGLKALVDEFRGPECNVEADLKSLGAWLTPNAAGKELTRRVALGWVMGVRDWLDLAAMRECLLTALACEKFRRAQGRNPDSLADLIPSCLSAAPADPWSGAPLEYLKEERLILSAGISRPSEKMPAVKKHRGAGSTVNLLGDVAYKIFVALPPLEPPPSRAPALKDAP